MRVVRIRSQDRDVVIGDQVRVADRWWPRLRGMIGRPEPGPGEGLLLDPCKGVHMQWMRYALDVAFLDGEGRVVALYHGLAPWRFSRNHKEAACAVELPVGTLTASGTEIGDRWTWSERERAAA